MTQSVHADYTGSRWNTARTACRAAAWRHFRTIRGNREGSSFFSENYIAFSHHPSLLPPHTALTSRLTGYFPDYFSAHCLFSCF